MKKGIRGSVSILLASAAPATLWRWGASWGSAPWRAGYRVCVAVPRVCCADAVQVETTPL